ncbi:MAG: hypothetical protein V3W41_17945 [Planctomycetota bacterium]
MSTATNVFEREYLATDGSPINIGVRESAPIEVVGNQLAVSTTSILARGSFSMFVDLYGSNDGVAWNRLDGQTITGFGHSTYVVSKVAAAFVRISILLSGSSSAVLFSSTISQSEQ